MKNWLSSSIESQICTNEMLYELFSQQLGFIYSRNFQNLVEDITANISFLNDYNIAKLRDLFKKKNLIRLFRAQLNLIRGDFKRTLVWPEVTFERSIVGSEVILSAQTSGQWFGNGLGQGRTKVWLMVWFRLDQWSFPSCKVWSATFERSSNAHEVSSAHQSDQR